MTKRSVLIVLVVLCGGLASNFVAAEGAHLHERPKYATVCDEAVGEERPRCHEEEVSHKHTVVSLYSEHPTATTVFGLLSVVILGIIGLFGGFKEEESPLPKATAEEQE